MHRLLVQSLVGLVTATALAVVPGAVGGPVAAETPLGPLPGPTTDDLGSFADMVVDEAHGRVFIGRGAGKSVIVTDLAGTTTGSLVGAGGADSMLLAEDGNTLYVARGAAHAVAAVDLATLGVTTFDLGNRCPSALAVAADRLWVSSSCSGDVAALDLASGEVTTALTLYGIDRLEASPADPNLVVVASSAGGGLSLYDAAVVEGVPTLTERAHNYDASEVRDLALSADGTELVTTGYGPPDVYSTSSAAHLRNLAVPQGSAMAARPDGNLAFGGNLLHLVRPGANKPWRGYTLGSTAYEAFEIPARGLAWGSERLYVVTLSYGTERGAQLHVVTPKGAAALAIRTRHDRVRAGSPVTVEVKLSTQADNRQVRLYAVDADRSRLLSTKALGEGWTEVTTTLNHTSVIQALYAGDEQTDSAAAGVRVTVVAALDATVTNAARKARGIHFLPSGRTAVVRGDVERVPGRCAKFKIEILKQGSWDVVDRTGCLTPSKQDRVGLRLHSKKGAAYYPIRVSVVTTKDDYNVESASTPVRIQFCPGRLPC